MPVVNPSNGPVAVTGASGFLGSHVVNALLNRGYTVHACVTDHNNLEKTDHLNALKTPETPGNIKFFTGDLFEQGSYDTPFKGCSAVLHVGTAMGYGEKYTPRDIYDGAVKGTKNVLGSIQKAATVKRLVFTSSFSAVYHPSKPGTVFTEKDWAGDNRGKDKNWHKKNIDTNGEVAYAMAKEEAEHLVYRVAEKDGRFDAISVCPIAVLGPLLSPSHELIYSWQYFLGRMLQGEPCMRSWNSLWNIIDVRDIGQAQALILENAVCRNGSRYQLGATDESGELSVFQLQQHLQDLFPGITIGGAPDEMEAYFSKYGDIYRAPCAHSDLARKELGLKTHAVEDTLQKTGQTMMDFGLIKPVKKGE